MIGFHSGDGCLDIVSEDAMLGIQESMPDVRESASSISVIAEFDGRDYWVLSSFYRVLLGFT